jgi:hypothetical protein
MREKTLSGRSAACHRERRFCDLLKASFGPFSESSAGFFSGWVACASKRTSPLARIEAISARSCDRGDEGDLGGKASSRAQRVRDIDRRAWEHAVA